jgi:TolA-binding protein
MVGMSNAPLAGSASELAFQRGIASLQAGNFSRAITELEKVVADPSSPVIEDGRFWIAVAYARAKRTHAAIDAFERFLEHHPTSVRFREASTMLGWQLFAMGDRDRARALFKQGIEDANPTVNRSARAGLEMIDDRAQVTAK